MESSERQSLSWQRLRVPSAAILAIGALGAGLMFRDSMNNVGGGEQIVTVPEQVMAYPEKESFGPDGISVVGLGVKAEDRELIRDIDCGGGEKKAVKQDNGDWLVLCYQSIKKNGFILKTNK